MSNRSNRRRQSHGERGQALVEFALVLIPFLFLIMGIFDLGRGMLLSNMLSNAVRDGARAGIIATKTNAQIATGVTNVSQLPTVAACSSVPSAPVTVDYTTTTAQGLTVEVHRGTQGSSTDPVWVRGTYCFQLITPLIGSVAGNPVRLQASTSMYIEQ